MTSGIPIPFPAKALVPFAIFALGSACERIPEKVEITETREISKYDPTPVLDVPVNDRIGRGRVLSILPENWVEREASEGRILSFTFGEKNEGEAYLSVLQSEDGTDFVTPNINRWRRQMGQPPLEPAEVDALPELVLFTQQAKKIVIDGSFTPVGAKVPRSGYRLIGAILQIPQFTFFVKLVAPVPLASKHEKNFDEFTTTLRFR